MSSQELIKTYFALLEKGDTEKVAALFEEEGVVFSPLYGKSKARDFYKGLSKDTASSRIKLLQIFTGNAKTCAGHFRYDWILKNGTTVSFECVDIFKISAKGKIMELTIIYDTFAVRDAFNRLKKESGNIIDTRQTTAGNDL